MPEEFVFFFGGGLMKMVNYGWKITQRKYIFWSWSDDGDGNIIFWTFGNWLENFAKPEKMTYTEQISPFFRKLPEINYLFFWETMVKWPFKWLSDLQLRDEKIILNHLEGDFCLFILSTGFPYFSLLLGWKGRSPIKKSSNFCSLKPSFLLHCG